MKILYFVNYFPPSTGAAALNTFTIVKYLSKLGHELMVLAPNDMGETFTLKNIKSQEKDTNIKISCSDLPIPYPLSFIFSHIENLSKFLIKSRKQFNPDIILSQYHTFHYASVVGAYASKILKIPHIIRSHDIFLNLTEQTIPFKIYNLFTYPLIFRSVSKCDIFYITASEMKEYLLKFKRFKEVQFKVHHNGIDTSQFYPINNKNQLKEQYNCDCVISFIGLMTYDIGLQHLISVFQEIIKSHKDIHLILIGDGPYKNYLLNLIRKFNLEKKISFLGLKPHQEIPFYINNSEFGIGRITHEEMWKYMVPVKCLEYMACKKTFLTTPISQDVLKNNDVGLSLPKLFNDKDLIDGIITLIEDKNLRKKLEETGFNKILKQFKWETVMNDFNQDLISLVK